MTAQPVPVPTAYDDPDPGDVTPTCLGCGGPSAGWDRACSDACATRFHARLREPEPPVPPFPRAMWLPGMLTPRQYGEVRQVQHLLRPYAEPLEAALGGLCLLVLLLVLANAAGLL